MPDEDRKVEAPIQEELHQIPRLPRGGGFRISTPNLIRTLLTAAILVMIIVVQRPCAEGVSSFVTSYGQGTQEYEQIRPGMTEAEIKAAIERAKQRAAEHKQ